MCRYDKQSLQPTCTRCYSIELESIDFQVYRLTYVPAPNLFDGVAGTVLYKKQL